MVLAPALIAAIIPSRVIACAANFFLLLIVSSPMALISSVVKLGMDLKEPSDKR